MQPCKPWAGSNFFHGLWIELRCCMCKATTSMTVGKILLAKTNWFFHVKSSLFLPFFIHSSDLTCHSTCPLPQRVLLSKRKNRLYESHLESHVLGGDSRQRNEFVYFEALAPRKSRFFMKFQHLRLAMGATMQTLSSFKLFPYPMDWAEVLHAQSYNINDSWKNTLGENELVLSCEIFDFPSKKCT